MPIYEYRCNSCKGVATFFVRGYSTQVNAICPHCNSDNMDRLISKVAIVKSPGQRLDELDLNHEQRALGRLQDPFDPADIARWAKRVGEDMDGELGTEFKEMANQVTAERRPYDLYDPIGAYQLAVERKRQELMKEAGMPVPEFRTITDEIIDSTPQRTPEWVQEAEAQGGPPKAPWEKELES